VLLLHPFDSQLSLLISTIPNHHDMSKKNLLICFDAFGTLFTPRKPVAQQYSEVARSFGLRGFSDDDIAQSFKKAFKHESKTNPNYGKKTGMGAEKWWGNVSRINVLMWQIVTFIARITRCSWRDNYI
jgi:hypothetical protein